MNIQEWLDNPENRSMLIQGATGLIVIVLGLLIAKRIKRVNGQRKIIARENAQVKEDNQALSHEIRDRLIENINMLSRIIKLNPVIPGNTPDDSTLESRNRVKCLAMIIEGLPRDLKGQGIRMAEFIHHLSDNLFQAYGKDSNTTHVLIDVHPLILHAECAAHIGLMFNELISNAFQYAPVPGEKSKVNIIFKERENKLFISVGDNGIGMKSPYIPKFSFGLQLVNTLVQKYKGEMIFSSRPGTRVEIILKEYHKTEREVFITPTTKVY
jgi:two-component sensor histidine kinase